MSTKITQLDNSIGQNQLNYPYMIKFETLPNGIKSDIKELCEANSCEYKIENEWIECAEVLDMYLQWNGIMGYTSAIMQIIESSAQCKTEKE